MDRLSARFTFILLPLWCGFLIAESSNSLPYDVRVVFPSKVLEGNTVTMYCYFDIYPNTSIYTVKWYKGRREFFRISPKEFPEKKKLPFIGIDVDEANSGINKVVLRRVPQHLTGKIVCEVTWEPEFIPVMKEKDILVVVPPERNPTLIANVESILPSTKFGNSFSGTSSNSMNGNPSLTDSRETAVQLGQTLKANCTSGPSKPATNLTFEINDSPATFPASVQQSITNYPNPFNGSVSNPPSQITMAQMTLVLQESHFQNRKIRVKCKSDLFELHSLTSDEFIAELPPERTVTASGYGGFGKNGETRRQSGKLVWSITTMVVGKSVLLSLKSFF